jgi:hypothetical protein
MKKQFYIVSTKHTSKADTALTLWGPNYGGYSWHKNRAGVYEEEDKEGTESEDAVFVDKEEADKLFMNGNDFGDQYISLPNDITVRTILGISDYHMKPKKNASCRIKFHSKYVPL